MAATPEERDRMLGVFDGIASWLEPAVRRVAGASEDVLNRARGVFDGLIDELPYVDRPDHVMADPMFACAASLAVYQVLRRRGVDAHTWGAATYALPAVTEDPEDGKRWRADAQASQRDAHANEFVFELVTPEGGRGYGTNITSCAICHLFGKHDAMDLVPYMCAFDDVTSRAGGTGLRRTGTIALGATHCDFRFQPGGEPLSLAEQFPERIRVSDE